MVSPTVRPRRVGLAPAYSSTARTARRPQHPFNVVTKPFQIQPVCLAPVLPGETMKSLLLQSQVWSDPLSVTMKSIGWWCEYNVFYVKHRDLPGWEIGTDGLGKDLIDMMVSGEALSPDHTETAFVPWTYTSIGGVDFVKNSLMRVVEEYFRDEGEAWNIATVDSVPLAQIYGRGRADAAERLTFLANYADRRVKLDVDNDGTIYVGDEINRAWAEWAAMRDAGVIDMDYRDWMRSYGGDAVEVTPDRVDHHRPEDIAYFREFTYPTNTVEPSTGVPAVAVGWRVASRIDKQVRFDEPGWIFVTNTIRPKVYLGNQKGSMASMMNDRNRWLPPQRNDEWTLSHVNIAVPNGPFGGVFAGATSYYMDVRDLLNHGEQFLNYTPPTAGGIVALPTVTGQRRYASSADIDAMFAAPASNRFRQDGMISLNILGRQQIKGSNLVLGKS